jgi:hypothetical protein
MEQKSGNNMKGITFVDAIRLMFDKANVWNKIYSAFSKDSSQYIVFILYRSIKINNALIDLLGNIPIITKDVYMSIITKDVYMSIFIIRIILSPMVVMKNVVKNVKNVSYNHMVKCLLDVGYRCGNI